MTEQDAAIAKAGRRYALAYVRYAIAQTDDPRFREVSAELTNAHSALLEACEPSLGDRA